MLHPKDDVVVVVEPDVTKILRVGPTDHLVDGLIEAAQCVAEPHARRRAGAAASAQYAYFEAIAEALRGAARLLVVGANEPKLAFVAHLQREHPTIFERVLGVEATARLEDRDLAAFARAQFDAG